MFTDVAIKVFIQHKKKKFVQACNFTITESVSFGGVFDKLHYDFESGITFGLSYMSAVPIG